MSQVFAVIGEKISAERSVGILWLHRNREVLYQSDLATKQLSEGPMRIDPDGKLEIVDPEDQVPFWALVNREIRTGLRGSGGIVLGKNLDTRQFVTFAATEGNTCAVLVRSLDHATENSEARLIDLFGLTQREAQLAMHLSRGLTLDEFATQNFLTINTVKTHLKQLFRKVGAKKQMQLAVTVWAAIR